tara:strand:- start:124 stop:249 length:126 start_codon:yes stop_codon:yes gene_type:complete
MENIIYFLILFIILFVGYTGFKAINMGMKARTSIKRKRKKK